MVIPGSTLIIVDDDPTIRVTLAEVFTRLGYTVRTAEDGFSALALIHESSPEILLSDLNMPGMSGFELLSVVRRMHPKIHVVATSGAFAGKSVPAGIAADAFYEKSTSLSFLFDIIKAERPSDRTPLRSPKEITPIWISPSGKLASEELYLLISCPHCLRAFPKVIAEEDGLFCKTDCLYCRTVIYYAIVPPGESAGTSVVGRSCSRGTPHPGGGSAASDAFFAEE